MVGINPSPVSVAAGHYYQGQLGQRFFQRLDEAGVINLPAAGFEDDAAYTAGIGFTDVVKRPTRRATGLHPGELEHGRELLDRKLSRLTVPKVLFTFKGSAEALLGPLARPGLQTHTISGAEVFVMPGPMAAGAITERVLGELQRLVENVGGCGLGRGGRLQPAASGVSRALRGNTSRAAAARSSCRWSSCGIRRSYDSASTRNRAIRSCA